MSEFKSVVLEPAIEGEILSVATTAKSFIVRSDEDLQTANDRLRSIKALMKAIDEGFDDVIARAHEAHKAAVAAKKRYYAPLQESEALIKRAMGAYHEAVLRERERIAREEREREEAKARELAKAEALDRAAAESKDRAEAATLRQMASESIGQAAALESIDTPSIPHRPQVEGTSFVDVWQFEVVDATLIPRTYLTVDLPAIGREVRIRKGDTRIPGVRVYATKSVRTRL